jgi:hypothetical protein
MFSKHPVVLKMKIMSTIKTKINTTAASYKENYSEDA